MLEISKTKSLDVAVMGRATIDIYANELGSLVDAKSFNKYIGGSAANTAVALSRLGLDIGYLGKVSGRDEDKISKVGFHVVKTDEEQPTFEEGKMVFVCKKLMGTQLNPEEFIDPEVDGRWYPQKDYHHMYTAEVIAAYRIEQ